MSEKQKDQRFIENLRANNLRAVEAGGCAPPVYVNDVQVPEGYILIQRRDAEQLARFGLNNAGNGVRAGVKMSAMRVFDLLKQNGEH